MPLQDLFHVWHRLAADQLRQAGAPGRGPAGADPGPARGLCHVCDGHPCATLVRHDTLHEPAATDRPGPVRPAGWGGCLRGHYAERGGSQGTGPGGGEEHTALPGAACMYAPYNSTVCCVGSTCIKPFT